MRVAKTRGLSATVSRSLASGDAGADELEGVRGIQARAGLALVRPAVAAPGERHPQRLVRRAVGADQRPGGRVERFARATRRMWLAQNPTRERACDPVLGGSPWWSLQRPGPPRSLVYERCASRRCHRSVERGAINTNRVQRRASAESRSRISLHHKQVAVLSGGRRLRCRHFDGDSRGGPWSTPCPICPVPLTGPSPRTGNRGAKKDEGLDGNSPGAGPDASPRVIRGG